MKKILFTFFSMTFLFSISVNAQWDINNVGVFLNDEHKRAGIGVTGGENYQYGLFAIKGNEDVGTSFDLIAQKEGGWVSQIRWSTNKLRHIMFDNLETDMLTIAPGITKEASRILHINGKMTIHSGPDGIAEHPDGYHLYVKEGILTEKVKVALKSTDNWADFVFADNYQLKSINQVESFIKENKHLPDMPSAEEVVENGINVAEMDAKLLQQIEELWLHMIELKKENEELKKELATLKEDKNEESDSGEK